MQSHCHHFSSCIHLQYVLWCTFSYCFYKNLSRKWFRALNFSGKNPPKTYVHSVSERIWTIGSPCSGKVTLSFSIPRSLWVLWQEEREIYEIQSWYRLDEILNMSALQFGCRLLCNRKYTADSNNLLNLFRATIDRANENPVKLNPILYIYIYFGGASWLIFSPTFLWKRGRLKVTEFKVLPCLGRRRSSATRNWSRSCIGHVLMLKKTLRGFLLKRIFH